MKKVISALLAMSMLVSAQAAFAKTSDGAISDSRNGKEVLVSDSSSKSDMPCFRAGDVLEFDVSELEIGNELTVISVKCGTDDDDLGNDTIQYINQITLDSASYTIKYVVRDIEDGIYAVKVNDESQNDLVFYYKVGTPQYSVVRGDGTDYYIKESFTHDDTTTYAIGFMGKATISSTDVSFSDAGVKTFGFRYYEDGTPLTTADLTEDQMAALESEVNQKIADQEITGSYTIFYVNTIYGVPQAIYEKITADATMTDAD